MNIFHKVLAAAVLVLLAGTTNTVLAGSQTTAEPQYSATQIVRFAKGIERQLAQDGARAVIIARAGRPANELPKGISFTHTAVAIYSQITLQNGEMAYGYAIHNLYQSPNNRGRSFLMTDYPVDFFWGAVDLRAGIIIPSVVMQKRIIDLVSTSDHRKLHNTKYSVLANPYNNMYQNCTEFTLDIVNAAVYETTNQARLKRNAQQYFSAQKVNESRMKLSMGSMVMKDLTLRDHKRTVRTATFGSLAAYMQQYGLAKQVYIVNSDLTLSQL
ncbi:MAG: DUF2145 domain-containing protein [Pseudomonadota bacterium]